MHENFTYSYNAENQKRLDSIRQKYSDKPKIAAKQEQLAALDRQADGAGVAQSLALGIAGTLVFGFGMCLGLVWQHIVSGVIVGIVGAAVLGCAYPLYKRLHESKRKALAPQILQLVSEIEKGAE